MVFSALSSTYQLYKQDTDSVATWLASTAKSLGYSIHNSSTTASTAGGSKPAAGGRLKGKARVQAKKQAATQKITPLPTGPKYIIGIKDFVPLAEYLAAKASPVPDTFRSTIDRVISARSGFGARLEEHGKTLSEVSGAKHQYFIGVLENVRKILAPYMPARDAKQNVSPDDNLSNRFAGLAVYEPSQEFLDAPDIERPVKTQGDNTVYEAETDTSLEHAFFALTSVINDMNRVRARIQWIWSNYKIGIFDVAAAAIATNTAINLVKNMMEDIVPLLNRHGGLEVLLQRFYLIQCFTKGWTPDELVGDGKEFNYDTYDVGCNTYYTAYQLLEALIRVLQPGQLPMYREGMFGYYDPASDRSRKTGWEKFKDDRALLTPFFTEIMTAVRAVKDWPVKDEFFRGLKELSETKQVPFYAVFAAQIFLDITYELGENIQSPFSTMISHTAFMNSDIKMHFDFHANLKIHTWPATNDMIIRLLQKNIQELGKDPLAAVQVDLYQRLGMDFPDKESHRIFRMSPVISGLFLYHFRCRYHEMGLAVADTWGSIQYCQHLYNALQREEMLDGRWRDMDVLTANLGEDSFYVGGEVPKTPREYFNKFCLQMGTSAVAMAKGRRKNIPLASKAGARSLKEASPVLSMFKERYVNNSVQVDFTPAHVSRIIELSRFEMEGAEEEGTLTMGQIEDPKKMGEKKKKLLQLQNRGQGRAVESGKLPLDQLIKPLVFALHAETLDHLYPYRHMHRWCWRLLRAVQDLCDPILRQIYTPAYLERESQLPWVVGWIFTAASGLDGGVSDRRPLELAAKAMNGFINAGTSSIVNKKVLGEALGMPIEFRAKDDSKIEA